MEPLNSSYVILDLAKSGIVSLIFQKISWKCLLCICRKAKSNKFVNSTQKLEEEDLVAAYDIIQGATFYLQLLHEIEICLKMAKSKS